MFCALSNMLCQHADMENSLLGRHAKEGLLRRGLLGEESKENCIKVTEPGPQYLFFLESKMVEAVKKNPVKKPFKITKAKEGTEKYHLKIRRSCTVRGSHHQTFKLLMARINHQPVEINHQPGDQCGKILLSPKESKKRSIFPRELVWFFGVERLLMLETGEENPEEDLEEVAVACVGKQGSSLMFDSIGHYPDCYSDGHECLNTFGKSS